MNVFSRWTRSATALAVAAAVVPLAIAAMPGATASAATTRLAATHADAKSVIQSVSYRRFSQLLERPGDSAFVVGSSAKDSNFATETQDVEAAARAAGLDTVYWLAPNNSSKAWVNLVNRDRAYLRNGVLASSKSAGASSEPSADSSDSYFFIYYRSDTIALSGSSTSEAPRIVSWINLTTQSSLASTRADVTTAIQNDRNLTPEDPLVIAHLSPRDDSDGCSSAITNPAEHPYYIEVQIDGQTYHDGCDTLPGYDDEACTPIPNVQYDFADNEIFYYDDQGDLLATAPWTEWQRISSYATWEAQQQAAASSSSGSGSSGSGSSGSGSGGSGSSGSSGSGSSGSSGSGSSSADAGLSRTKIKKVVSGVSKSPTSKSAGTYKVTLDTPSGKSTATGKVTVRIYKVGGHTQLLTGTLSKGVVTVKVSKLAKGTWRVLISWVGNSHYLSVSAAGNAIKVTK